MKTHRDDFDLAAELRALRPTPRAEFSAELDLRAASGFAEDGGEHQNRLSGLVQALRGLSPRRLALPAAAAAFVAVAIATALIAVNQNGQTDSRSIASHTERSPRSTEFSEAPKASKAPALPPGAPSALEAEKPRGGLQSGYQYSEAAPQRQGGGRTASNAGVQSAGGGGSNLGATHRDVERGAELVLRSAPGEIEADAKEVFATVRAAHGIVLDSSIHDWTANAGSHAGEARAGFELLIPSGRLGDTMASLSRIAAVRSRHESTSDITAPTMTVRDRLRDSEAKIEGLLAQLANTASDEERATVEGELRRERRRAAALRGQLDRLHRRARFARVTVRIEGGATGDSGSASWGVDDALGDAGRILVIAAGVVVIGLAALAPLALIALLAWLASRAWVRRRREQALS
jgi:hypothetical protein